MRKLALLTLALAFVIGPSLALACEGYKSAAKDSAITTADGSTVIVTQTPRPDSRTN